MKKLLYIIPTELFDNSDGVTKKAKQQMRAFEKNQYQVFVASYNGNKIVYCIFKDNKFEVIDSKQCNKYLRRNFLFEYVKKHLAGENFDVSYTRYPYASFKFIGMLKDMKKHNTKNIVEIPTYPIPRDLPKKLKYIPYRLNFFEEKLCVGKMKLYVDEIYSMGKPTETIFGIKNTNIPNGIDVSEILPRIVNKNENELHILYCGSLFYYQGVDRIINGLANYYAAKEHKDMKVYLEVVGDGPCMEEWKKLVCEKNLSSYVDFHGFLFGNKLNEIINKCNIACSLLASHRSKLIINASPLKTKEYLARGIPFIYAYDDKSMPENLAFALKIKSEESAIDMNRLIEFFDTYKMRQDEMITFMRDFAQKHYSWEQILKDV